MVFTIGPDTRFTWIPVAPTPTVATVGRTQRVRRRLKDRNRSRRRRYTIGPLSYLDRLRRAALGDHVCRPFTVRLED